MKKQGIAVVGLAAIAVGGLAACSGSSSSSSSTSASPATSSASPTMTPTETSSPVIGATCTKASLQTVTPDGAQINAFKCGSTGDGQVAAVEYGPGVNVVFAQTTGIGGPWEIINKNKVCGTASAGLPPAVLAFCSKA